MRGREYTELKAFEAIVAFKTFAKAANQLRISPSALSQTIKHLEGRLGTRLFNRTTRSVVLTDAGKQLHKRLCPILKELELILGDVREQGDRLSGTVKLHSTSMAANDLLAPIIGQFYEQYPDICLDIVVEDRVVDIISDEFDAGICLGEFLQNDLVAYPLGDKLTMQAAASPDYIARYGEPQTPFDLHHHQCINWRYQQERGIYRWEFFQQGHWFSLSVNGPLTTSSRDLSVAAALGGVGIVFWTVDRLKPWVDKGELVPLLSDYCPPFLGWHLCYPRQQHTSRALRALIDFLREAYPKSGIDESPMAMLSTQE